MARIRYAEEVRQDALRQILEEHLSVRDVARRVGCNVNSVYALLRRQRRQQNQNDQRQNNQTQNDRSRDATFLPVRIVQDDAEENGDAGNRIEMILPNGITFKIAPTSPEFIAKIVKELVPC